LAGQSLGHLAQFGLRPGQFRKISRRRLARLTLPWLILSLPGLIRLLWLALLGLSLLGLSLLGLPLLGLPLLRLRLLGLTLLRLSLFGRGLAGLRGGLRWLARLCLLCLRSGLAGGLVLWLRIL